MTKETATEPLGHKVIAGVGSGIGRAVRAVGSRFDADHAAGTAYAAVAAAVVLSGAMLGFAVNRADVALAAGTGASLAVLAALAAAVDRLYLTARSLAPIAEAAMRDPAIRLATGGVIGPDAGPVVADSPAALLLPKMQDNAMTRVDIGPGGHVRLFGDEDDDPAQDRG